MNILNLLFPKLWCSFADPEPPGGASGDQHAGDGNGNDGRDGDGAGAPTDEISIGEHKTTLDELRKIDGLKDYFDAYDNRERWQSENTRKSQEIAEVKRQAREFQRLMADPRFQQFMQGGQGQPQGLRQQFVNSIRNEFQDVDPRFLERLGDWMEKFAGHTAQRSLEPFQRQYGEQTEREFLKAHPDVQKGSEEYYRISDLVSSGVDAEDAYALVYKDKIRNAEIEAAIKKRDEENKLKLQRSRQSGGTQGRRKSPESFDDAFEEVFDELSSA